MIFNPEVCVARASILACELHEQWPQNMCCGRVNSGVCVTGASVPECALPERLSRSVCCKSEWRRIILDCGAVGIDSGRDGALSLTLTHPPLPPLTPSGERDRECNDVKWESWVPVCGHVTAGVCLLVLRCGRCCVCVCGVYSVREWMVWRER